MSRESYAFVAKKCRDCPKRTEAAVQTVKVYGDPGAIIAQDLLLVDAALHSTAVVKPLTVGIELEYRTVLDGQRQRWTSYRCEDPPCLIAILRSQAFTSWKGDR